MKTIAMTFGAIWISRHPNGVAKSYLALMVRASAIYVICGGAAHVGLFRRFHDELAVALTEVHSHQLLQWPDLVRRLQHHRL